MRTTLIIKEDLLNLAMELTNISEKTKLVHAGLEALIEKHARKRLAALGGSDSKPMLRKRRKSKLERRYLKVFDSPEIL